MFDKVLKFIIENSRLNYTLFILVFCAGIWSYNNTSKEVFPNFDLDIILISGSYSGTSVDVLNKIAVTEIENNLKNLNSIDTITTAISSGRFSIYLELKKNINKYNEANKIKDIISLIKTNLPSDMDEPNVKVIEKSKSLLDISLNSSKYTTNQLIPFAKDFKNELMTIKGIDNIDIYGESKIFFEIQLDDKKIEALELDKNDIFNSISRLSYIYPIGKIEDKNKHYYISISNIENNYDLNNTLIRINNKSFYLNDIAKISKKYEDSSTLFSFNSKNAISLNVDQSENSDALTIVKEIKELLSELNKENKDIEITVFDDNSKRVAERLNIVISNIILGIILITVLVMVLINFRMSMIIAIGIPTSFVIAAIYMYLSGFTINLISLVGVLIAIGIVVDDAIVVSENIQQYIEKGYSTKEASFLGTKEMIKPVTIASITTLFSFLPILMIDGTMGQIIKLIPIALSALIVASLIESFIFLPIHAAHILKDKSKVTSWKSINKIYNRTLHFFMEWKKTFLLIFIIFVPCIIYFQIINSKFNLFPSFNASNVKVTIKANKNTTINQSFEILKKIEKEILKQKDKFFIKNIDSVAGYRRDLGGSTERLPYVMFMTIELDNMKPLNIVDKFITPNLSFYDERKDKIRDKESKEIAKELKNFIKEKNFKKIYNLDEIEVLEKKAGPVKVDLEIGLISKDTDKIISSIKEIENKLATISGVKSYSNSLKLGVDETKLKINSYGQSLGITESFLGNFLSNLYLEKKKTVTFGKEEILDIKIKSLNKNDFKEFKKTLIPIPNNRTVTLEQIVDFKTVQSFEQLIKDNGKTNFYIYANLDSNIITSGEIIDNHLKSIIEKLEENGLEIVLKGEEEKKKSLKKDMFYATGLALILILIAILYLFNSFKDTFIVMSIIPFSLLGVLMGHEIMSLNLSFPSIIGALGLSGVVINDGIIMMTYLKKAKTLHEIFEKATKRFRPIMLTSITTIIGMSSLIFFPSGQAVIFQPIAIALGFGLAWGTILNLIYLPIIFTISHRIKN